MLKELKNENNYTTTENGAMAYKSTLDANLDFFAMGSAMRNRHKKDKIDLFMKAFKEDKELALKNLFYSRDIRGGQGERETFREILEYLAINGNEKDINILSYLIALVPEYGRWDDLYLFHGTCLWNLVIEKMHKQLMRDIASETPSLMAKWLKSENASSIETRTLAIATRKGFGMKSKDYRKTLTALRAKIKILETKLTEKDYESIDYSKVPSQAGMLYRKAFIKNDNERYSKYLESLTSGEVKINAGTLTPSQIIKKVLDNRYEINELEDSLLDGMWNNLPSYGDSSNENCLAVIDVSGSMYPDAINTAIGLGLYIAEKNTGEFHNHFLTFSNKPELVEVKGDTIKEKVLNISKANWGMNTDFEATFKLILKAALRNEIPKEEMPSRLIVISDMEFDESFSDYYGGNVPILNDTLMDKIRKQWKSYGYELPRIVFWNVDSRNDNIPMVDTELAQLVSGSNPVLFETLVKGETLTAEDIMLSAIDTDRYKAIGEAIYQASQYNTQ